MKNKPTEDTFQCRACGEIYQKSRPDYLAEAEAERTFGKMPDDPATVCTDCYRKIMKWLEENPQPK